MTGLKLNTLLLIDDNEADNFLHTLVIEEAQVAQEVVAVQSGYEALDYLTTKTNGAYPQPDVIFLDVNMPRMNGWEFLAAYDKLSETQKGDVVVVMLTTSLNPDDREAAEKNPNIRRFENKPLTEEALARILEEHFPSRFTED
ncbi:MAG: response regulator [Rhodothermales bacterium]